MPLRAEVGIAGQTVAPPRLGCGSPEQRPATVELCSSQVQWDRYVSLHAASMKCHQWAWGEAVHHTYGHESFRLAATANGTIQGVLPLCFVRSRIFANRLISMPFCSYGGALADNDSQHHQLLSAAVRLAQNLGARRIDLREGGGVMPTPWVRKASKVTMLVRLPGNSMDLWKVLSSGMRNKIRNARKQGLRIEWNGSEGVDAFYRIFSANMRNLGTPVYPRSWFANLCRFFPKETQFVTVWDAQEAVASGIVISSRDSIELPWSGSLPQSRKKYSAVLMYWSVLEWAADRGYQQVDLGRCTAGGGTYEFKRHFGCFESPLNWYYWLAPGASIPEASPDNPRYRLATRLWQHLPVSVANRLGPLIVRSLP